MHWFGRRRARRLLVIAAVGLGATAGVSAGAMAISNAYSDPQGVYHGCVNTASGLLRVVDPSASDCRAGETAITWNQTGAQGIQGPKGDQGDSGALASLDSVNGLSCTRSSQTGTAEIAYDANGVATIRCVVDTPPSDVPPDGINNVCASAVNLGVLAPGVTTTRQGTTSPAGTEDWFQASFTGDGPLQVTLTADAGITFDIVGPCGTTFQTGQTSTKVWGPNPFLIRVGGDTGVTGFWKLTVSHP